MRKRYFLKCGVAGTVFWLFLSIPSVSHPFQPQDVEKLLKTRVCQWCDLSKANLTGAKLHGVDLSGANLSGAVLTGADLSQADLSNAYLHEANLSDANLTDAYLVDADLRGATVTGANLTDAELSNTLWTDGTRCEKGSEGRCITLNLLGAYE